MQQRREPQQDDELEHRRSPGARQLVEERIVELAPVQRHEARNELLLEPDEARQVRVRDQVAAVVVIARVRDIEPDFVQPRGPHEQRPQAPIGQLPAASDLLEQRRGRRFDARRLLQVDVVPPLHRSNRALARVLVVQAAEHVVQQTLAERAAADVERLDLQSAHDLRQNRDATREHGHALRSEPRQRELLDAPRLDHLLDDGFDGREGDAVVAEPHGKRDVARGAHRARRADRVLPAAAPKRCSDRSKLEPHREPRALETFRAELAVGEMRAADADAADVQALEMLRLVAFADDELGAAAADVDDESRAVRGIRVMRDAEIDQARLFDAGDDVDGMAERFLGLREECLGIARTPQRVGTDDAHLMRLHVAQPLAEPPQAGERTLLARLIETAFVIETGGQADHLAQPVDDGRLAVLSCGPRPCGSCSSPSRRRP